MARADGVGVQPLVMDRMMPLTPAPSFLKGLLSFEPFGATRQIRLVGGSMLAIMLWDRVVLWDKVSEDRVSENRLCGQMTRCLFYLGKYFLLSTRANPRMRLQGL